MRAIIILVLSIAVVGAAPQSSERIVGGITTTVDRYPYIAALLVTLDDSVFYHFCGGSIINYRSILTAAHCTTGDLTPRLRVRLGSTYSTSGGVVYTAETVFNHANFDTNIWTTNYDNDISIIRTTTSIAFVENLIQLANLAGSNYLINDNDVVWPAGWGMTAHQGSLSEVLRHAQTWVINQEVCTARYGTLGYTVTANMICTGWLNMGGRGQCSGDSGGPVVHNGVVIGITSWSYECALGQYPTVSTRPSSYVNWIQARV